MRFLIEPAERGSGLMYTSLVKPRDIKVRYQREVERRIPMSLEQGPKGWEVTDLKITLIEGSDHEQHTHPLDFVAATGWAIEDGLRNTRTRLLEPILVFRMVAPADTGGRICNELLKRRAVFEQPVFRGDLCTVEGEVPAATSKDIPLLLRHWSGGKGSLTTRLARYDLAPDEYNDNPENYQAKRLGVSFRTYM